nr:EOG090X06T3 [Eulimnadia texana]
MAEPPPYPGNRNGPYVHIPPNATVAGTNSQNADQKRFANPNQQLPYYYPVHPPNRRPANDNPASQKPYIPLGDVQILWKSEDELISLGAAALAKRLVETHSRLSSMSSELKTVKSSYQRLQEDNQELRDLCCFLDDDRQKGRKLAREWQRFGRYTASVMRQEVANYQSKLRELESRQQELVKDNIDLKELCLYLDEERFEIQRTPCPSCGATPSPPPPAELGGLSSQPVRDDGDGSSSSTNADEPRFYSSHRFGRNSQSGSQERLLDDRQQRSQLYEQLLRYTRTLELRVSQLETERNLSSRPLMPDPGQSSQRGRPLQPPPYNAAHHQRALELGIRSEDSNSVNSLGDEAGEAVSSSRPEAVTRALRVLQIRESVDSSIPSSVSGRRSRGVTTPSSELDEEVDSYGNPDALGESERAIVHAMCNVY